MEGSSTLLSQLKIKQKLSSIMHLDLHHTYKNYCYHSGVRRGEILKDMVKNQHDLRYKNNGNAKCIVDC